jgi:hypothetical protein
LFANPLSRGIVLILVLNGIPTYELMSNTYRPSWTAPAVYANYHRTGTFMRVEEGIVFGINVQPYDVAFRERWHRLRIGYPASPITVDFEQHKKQIQGRIETNWLLMRLFFTFILWIILERLVSRAKRLVRN